MLRYYYVFLVGLLVLQITRDTFCTSDVRELKCLVCTRLVEEMQKNISQIDEKKKINVGGFRLDDQGNYSEKIVPYMRSEIFLTELMDNICNKMDDYVRATYKNSGKLTVLSLVSDKGEMNPLMSEVDVVQDADLNKSLKYYCEDILDENDETFLQAFRKQERNIIKKICSDSARLCEEETVEVTRKEDEL